jgi:tetratricopeptide (TPR) repeat protein
MPEPRTSSSSGPVVVGVVLLIVIGAIVIALGLRGGAGGPHASPPAPATDGMEAPLATRIATLTAAVRADPTVAEAWGRLGGVFDVHELDAEAIRCYEEAERLQPKDFRWPYFLGISRAVGDQGAAVDDFRRAAALRPDHAPVHVHLGRGLLFTEQLDEAERHFTEAARLDPTLIRAHLGLAQVDLARGNVDAAVGHLEHADALGPREGEVDWLLAEAYRRQGHELRADARLARARTREKIEPLPDEVRRSWTWTCGATFAWHRTRGDGYVALGRYADAEHEWRQAIEHYPDRAEAHGQLGLVLANTGRHAEAIAPLTRGLELDPEMVRIRRALGTALIRAGRTEDGLAELRTLIAARPDDATARLELVAALILLQRDDEAAAALEALLAQHPDHVRARFEYGVLLIRMNRLDDAIDALRQAAAMEPSQPATHLQLARALEAAGRWRDAADALRTGLGHVPGDVDLALALAWPLATSPDPQRRDGAEALRVLEPLGRDENAASNPKVLDALAAAHAEQGNFETALVVVRRARALTRGSGSDGYRGLLALREQSYERGEPFRQPAARP